MSVELLEDDEHVLVEKADAMDAPSSESSSGSDDASKEPSSAPNKSAKERASELARQVDELESATDEPALPEGGTQFDALAVKLPHLPSPFDAAYPRSRGGDQWEAIVPDGHCMMSTLEPGEGENKVPVLNRVYVNVEGKLQDGTSFYEYDVEELDFTLGQAQVPKGLEMAVCQMKLNQHSLIRCYSDYGFSSTRRPPNVPADAVLFLRVRVLRWEKEKNLHEMTLEDKYDYCERRRQLAKDLFSTGRKPRSAIKHYDRALSALASIQEFEVGPSTVQRKRGMQVLFWVNQAQCWMKVGDYSQVVELCNKALNFQPRHVKALFRRAEARKAREEWDEAEKDYKRLLEIHEEAVAQTDTSQSESAASSSSSSSSAALVPASSPSSSSQPASLDALVLQACRQSLQSIRARRSSDSHAQRRRMDGFLARANESLYGDMPMVGPDAARKEQPEDDYEWLARASRPQPGLWTDIKAKAASLVDFVRGWCSRPRPAAEREEGKKEQ